MNEKQTNGFVSLKSKKDFLKLFVKRGLITEQQMEKNGNLIHNEILGFTTATEIDRALRAGAIKKWKEDGRIHYGIATIEQIINGKKVLCIAQAYLDFDNNSRRRKGADYYRQEAMNNLNPSGEINVNKVFETFPGSKRVN